MTPELPRKDLVLLLADRNMVSALQGLLERHESLAIRLVEAEFFVHPDRDPACLLRSHEFLRPFVKQYDHALVLFDREGCGKERLSREELERQVEGRLSASGWERRSAAVVLDPELEVWVWSDSPHVEDVLGWTGRIPGLRSWLDNQGLFELADAKPRRPKEAMQMALRASRKPRSSSLYFQLAKRVSLTGCIDPAFRKFRDTLQSWFPPEQ